MLAHSPGRGREPSAYSHAAVGALVADYFRAYRWRWIVGVLFTWSARCSAWSRRGCCARRSTRSLPRRQPTGLAARSCAAAIVFVALIEGASRFLARLIITGASRWVEYDLRNRYFEHLETLEPAFFVRYRTGDLVARATNDLSAVRQSFGPALYHIVNTTLLTGPRADPDVPVEPGLATWAALVVPIAACVFLLSHRHIERRFTRVQEQFAAMATMPRRRSPGSAWSRHTRRSQTKARRSAARARSTCTASSARSS